MRTDELQATLRALGFDPGPTDGIYGELTEEAIFDALEKYAPPVVLPPGHIPPEWMPECHMERIICHWTAGSHKANETDIHYYHIVIEGDGHLVRGSYSIKDNADTSDGRYAAHTKNCNTGSIGVSLACMAGSTENPFYAGDYPMTEKQWETLSTVVAELAVTYGILITPTTVLSHAEVQNNLGIAQSGKWDYTRLPFDDSISGAKACGDRLRGDVVMQLNSVGVAAVGATSSPTPVVNP